MSVTFMLPREFRTVTQEERTRVRLLPCSTCGGHDDYCGAPNSTAPNLDCEDCQGYGGDHDAKGDLYLRDSRDDGEFNVASANARYIVQDLLNLSCEEVDGGSLDPTTVLMRCATVFDTSRGIEQPSTSQGVRLTAEGVGLGCMVVNAGRSQRQCDSYVDRLRRLAEIALERGAPEIYWG